MSLRNIFLLIVLAVGVGTCGLCWIAGMFDPLDMSTGTEGPFYTVYREYRGSYEGIRVVLADVHNYLKYKKHQSADRGFAIFYSSPSTAGGDSLRCIGGCLTDSLLTAVDTPYLVMKIDSAPAIVGTFPIRTFLSYTTGSLKFAAKLNRFQIAKHLMVSGPVMAVYDMPARQIRYYAPTTR
jgi:hypothetical protein